MITSEVLDSILSLDESTRPTRESAQLDALIALDESPQHDKFSSKLGNRLALSIFDSLN